MICVAGVAAEGVKCTEHVPLASAQLVGENVPAPLAVNVTVPVGDEPDTVAVHVVA